MACIHWNCHGYSSNYGDLCNLLQTYQPACVLLQETMLGNRIPRPPGGYNINTYSPTGNPVPDDGLAVLVRRECTSIRVPLDTQLQAIAFRVRMSKLYTVCNLYLRPNEGVDSAQLIHLISQLPPPFIVMGDFNAHSRLWGNSDSNRSGRILESVLLVTSAVILNTGQPTYLDDRTGTLSAIDISLCSPELSTCLSWHVHHDLCGSDHYPVVLKELGPVSVTREPRYIYSAANWPQFSDLTRIHNLNDFLGDQSISECLASIERLLLLAADHSIPKTSGRPRKHRLPWWNRECRNAAIDRKRALRLYQRHRSIENKISYNRARARTREIQNEAREHSWKTYVSTLTKDTPMSKIWARIQKMRGIYRVLPSPYINHNNEVITDPVDVAQLLATHYEAVSSSASYCNEFQRIKRQQEALALHFDTEEVLDYNCAISLLELRAALKASKNTAPGNDKISYQMLKRCHPSVLQALVSIYNQIWSRAEYPLSWQMATILSFPKPNKPPGLESSYRPISLTSCVGKLMEKVVNYRLTHVLENNKMLPPHQYGFRHMHSTTDALIRVTSDIHLAFRQGNSVLAVFLDIHKAYDRTWRCGVMHELHSIGIRGSIAHFIYNFLNNRTFRVRVGDILSPICHQEQGVPQGSVLSCSLFSVALNPVLKCLPEDVKGSLYVDDLMIYIVGRYFPTMERRLQLALNKISKWISQHGFAFSADTAKNVCIHFSRKRGLAPEPTLRLDGRVLQCRETIKFLGMVMDSRLRCRPHIVQLKKETMQRMNIVKCLSHTNRGADREIKLRVYRSIIRSKIDYCSVIYGSASENILKMLDPIHNQAVYWRI